jgi:ATP-dependent protease ClpP protease subunit
MSENIKVQERTDNNSNFENSVGWNVDVKNRVIRITTDIDTELFDIVDAGLTELESISKKAITIRISSYGGGVYEALAIIGRMEKSKCKIITEGYGPIMSAATAILAAGNERRMSRRAWFMHHESSYGIEGRHNEIKHYVKQQEREENDWAKLMEELTGTNKNFWITEGKNIDRYFSAQECLQLNIVDKLF